jgi:flagellin-like protein
MKFQRKRGVSVVIATLLMIAITVSAAIIVYVFVGGLAGNLTQGGGQSVTEKLLMQSYNFQISPGLCGAGCVQEVLEIFLLNPGPSTTKITAIYYDGNLASAGPGMNGVGTFPVAAGSQFTVTTNPYSWFAATSGSTLTSTAAGTIFFGNSPAASQTYAVTQVGQVVICLSAAATYGSAHTIKVVSSTGAQNVFTVEAGISG